MIHKVNCILHIAVEHDKVFQKVSTQQKNTEWDFCLQRVSDHYNFLRWLLKFILQNWILLFKPKGFWTFLKINLICLGCRKLILRKKLSSWRLILCFCGFPLKLGPAGPGPVIHTEVYSYLIPLTCWLLFAEGKPTFFLVIFCGFSVVCYNCFSSLPCRAPKAPTPSLLIGALQGRHWITDRKKHVLSSDSSRQTEVVVLDTGCCWNRSVKQKSIQEGENE